jgi:hypothetical protein
MTRRIVAAALALVLALHAAPLWAETGRAGFDSITETLDSSVPPAGGAEGGAEPPEVAVAGRLLLPWGNNSDGHRVVLSLRNDSKNGPRAFQAFFFNPAGEVVAVSEKTPLPPRGSVAFPVDEIIAEGAWLRGSIEIHYAGPGPGRLYGSATQVDPDPEPRSDTQPLVQAGFHVKKEQPAGRR